MQMNKNPFVLPGFGQGGQLGQNPILASMEMMRQAWEGLARAGAMEPGALSPVMSVEEMDKRIADLRAVENWLRMNLSMLSSTIQGLEVQRATVATIKSFVDTGMATMAQGKAASEPAARGASGVGPGAPQGSTLDRALNMRPSAAGADTTQDMAAMPSEEASEPCPTTDPYAQWQP